MIGNPVGEKNTLSEAIRSCVYKNDIHDNRMLAERAFYCLIRV